MKRFLSSVAAVGVALFGIVAIPNATAATTTLNMGVLTDIKDWQASSAQLSNFGPYYQAVYDTLLGANSDGSVKPALATSWSYSSGNKVLTLNLRSDVKFSNGETFDAAAAAKNLLAFSKGLSPNASTGANIVSASADGGNANVLKIKLGKADPSFLAYLSQSLGFMQAPSTIGTAAAVSTPVGSGPYILDKASSVSGATYVFKANPNYWDAANRKFSELNLKVLATPAAAVNAIKAGQVDVVTILDNTSVASLKASGLAVDSQQLNWVGIVFVDKAGRMGSPLKDVRVRQAINYGIDRAAALQVMGAGYGVPTTQVFAKYNRGYVASLDNAYPFSIDKAKSLLKDAGYPNGFKLEMPLNGALNPAVGQFIKDSLEKIGIIVNYTSYASGSDFFAAVQAPKYAMFRQGLERNPNSWTLLQFLLARDSAWNPSGYGDATSDKLISRIAHASGDVQTKLFAQLNTYIVRQAWHAPLYASDNYVAYKAANVKVKLHAGNSTPFLSDISPA